MPIASPDEYFKCSIFTEIDDYRRSDSLFGCHVYVWCIDNLTGLWYINDWRRGKPLIFFELKEDYILFKLTW